MHKHLSLYILIITIGFTLINCANRGTPSGGAVDKLPPEITKSFPENYSTNFSGNEIKIYFDEFIKIKNLQKNLIISPPMDPEPEIRPLGSASKYITIKIHDTLKKNTTYAFNFGESIVDNNEENPYPYYRYVFSTGDYIDSLNVSGSISDALRRETDEFVNIMLYEIDSTFNDSIIYNKRPNYITNTLDSTTTFNIENVKAGQYMMIALKEESPNYTFQQKLDKIAFLKEVITLPTENTYELKLFKEAIDFKATRPKLISGQKIAFGYEGSHEDMKIKLLSERPSGFTSIITKDPKTDSLYYWYKPKLETDSLVFTVSNMNYLDTLVVKIKDQEKDSLFINAIQSGTISFNDDYEIEANTPLVKFDKSKVSIFDKDSANVDYNVSFNDLTNRYKFSFNKTEKNNYRIKILPEAFTDFFGHVNDTLNYTLKTKELSDYGNLRINLQNAIYPVIVQLINQKDDVIYEEYASEAGPIDFKNLNPNTYYIRVVFDTNENGQYDSGNYLKKRQPERVSYYPDILEVRASFDQIIDFTLLKE